MSDQEIVVSFIVVGIGLLVLVGIWLATYESPEEKRKLAEAKREAEHYQRAVEWIDGVNPKLEPGDQTILFHDTYQLNANGEVHYPKIGYLNVAGLRRTEAEAALRVAMAHHAVKDDRAIREFDKRMSVLVDAPVEPQDLQGMHERHLSRHMLFSCHGHLISVLVQAHPSGGMDMRWEFRESGVLPYFIWVRENGVRLECGRLNRIHRFLARGRDYEYSFNVYDETMIPDRYGNRRNLEEDLLITVNIPTVKKWSWEAKTKKKSGKALVQQIAAEIADQREAERLIDQLAMSEEDAMWVKAKVQRAMLEE
jgi:hypothetical protein